MKGKNREIDLKGKNIRETDLKGKSIRETDFKN